MNGSMSWQEEQALKYVGAWAALETSAEMAINILRATEEPDFVRTEENVRYRILEAVRLLESGWKDARGRIGLNNSSSFVPHLRGWSKNEEQK